MYSNNRPKNNCYITHVRILIFLLCFSFCASPSAKSQKLSFDDSDSGIYGVVHIDGHLTDMKFRFTQKNDEWKIESLRPDGSWEDVTCEAGCILVESTNADIEKFMGGTLAEGASAKCAHNSAFAFCRVMGSGATERRYVLVALIDERVIPIKLARIE